MVKYGVTGHLTFETYGLVGSLAMVSAILLSAGGLHRQIPHLHQPPPRQRFRLGQIVSQVGVTLSNRNFLSLFMEMPWAETCRRTTQRAPSDPRAGSVTD